MAGIQRATFFLSTLTKTAREDDIFTPKNCGSDNHHDLFDVIFFCFSFSSSLAVGTKTGYKLYSLGSVEKLEEIYQYGKKIHPKKHSDEYLIARYLGKCRHSKTKTKKIENKYSMMFNGY